MDPDEALALLRRFMAEAQKDVLDGTLPSRLSLIIEHFESLDEWLSKGGFLPADWRR